MAGGLVGPRWGLVEEKAIGAVSATAAGWGLVEQWGPGPEWVPVVGSAPAAGRVAGERWGLAEEWVFGELPPRRRLADQKHPPPGKSTSGDSLSWI